MEIFRFALEGLYCTAIGTPLGILLEKLYQRYKIRREFSLIKEVFPVTLDDNEIEVKCSVTVKMDGRNPASLRAYVHSAETLALQKVAKYLDDVSIKLKFSSFYGRPQEDRNLLLIGSGSYNELSEDIMRDMGELSYNRSPNSHAYFTYQRKKFTCIHSNDTYHRVIQDYGVILRKPVWESKIVLLLAGIHMHGTLAAVEVAMSSEFQKKIKEIGYQYYAQLLKVTVAKDGLSLALNGIDWKNLPLIELK